MKEFLLSLALMVVIAGASALVLGSVDMSSQTVYQQHGNVRL